MKTISLAAARRYARALFDVALQGQEEGALRAELARVARAVAEHRELQGLLTSPAFKLERKRRLLEAVFPKASPLLRRLLALLAERDRLELLPAIARGYTRLLLEHQGTTPAEVVTAQALDADQRARLEAALRAAVGRSVELETHVEEELLGGVLVKIAGRHYDGSVRGRLTALRERLSAASL